MKKNLFFTILLFTFSTTSYAQTSTFSQTFGSSGIDQIRGLQTNDAREIFIAGTFGDDFNIGNKNLFINGLEDIFISKINTNNETVWAKSLGSNDRDKITGFRLFEDSLIYFSGVFWDNITFDAISLSATGNALFVAQLDSSGNSKWVNAIYGNSSKTINEGVTDNNGNYYITGSFSANLYFPNDTLTAQGLEDAFVAKYDKNGLFLWAKSIGYQRYTEATGLTVNNIGAVYIAGQFNGRVIFGNDTLWASALDFDLFFAKYDANGNLIFGKRFGGIYDNTNPKLALGIFGKVAMAGTFVGLLNFDQTSIQTSGLDSDIFLAVFDDLGSLLSVGKYGDTNPETLQGLAVNIDDYYLSGYFNTSTTFGNTSLTTSVGNLQNFVIRMTEFQSQTPNVVSYPTSQFSSSILVTPHFNSFLNREILIAGIFEGTINLPTTTPSPVSNGFTDIFLMNILMPLVNTNSIEKQLNFKIFPNPTTDLLTIDFQDFNINQSVKIHIINSIGQIQKTVFINENLSQIDVSNLPKGIYFLKIIGNENIQVGEFLKN
jgi:hypothetical protein